MLHYHVWFNLKPNIDEANAVEAIQTFLAELQASGHALGGEFLKNQGTAPNTKLPKYHAFVRFADEAALAAAMKYQREAGIHHGGHGGVVRVACEIQVEVFSVLSPERQNA